MEVEGSDGQGCLADFGVGAPHGREHFHPTTGHVSAAVMQGGFDPKKALAGIDKVSIDTKGRILLGKEKGEILGNPFVVAMGPRGCLALYSCQVWEEQVSRLGSVDTLNPAFDLLSREVFGLAEYGVTCDKEYRFVLPRGLRDEANLKSRVVLLGCGNRVELWDNDEYVAYKALLGDYKKERYNAIQQAYRDLTGVAYAG
ncbi:MAG: hypothetical protein KIS66_01105 [Fimbriimonadaceae bacterium]|nr:hypothetical protein [Fimbriimonadaceae bacterium]